MALTATCSCGRQWTGTSQAHCAFGCHEHFSTVHNFDLHQPRQRAQDGSPRCGKPGEMTRTKRDGSVVPPLKAVVTDKGVTWVGFTEDPRFGDEDEA
jgi:hypothetical protein